MQPVYTNTDTVCNVGSLSHDVWFHPVKHSEIEEAQACLYPSHAVTRGHLTLPSVISSRAGVLVDKLFAQYGSKYTVPRPTEPVSPWVLVCVV